MLPYFILLRLHAAGPSDDRPRVCCPAPAPARYVTRNNERSCSGNRRPVDGWSKLLSSFRVHFFPSGFTYTLLGSFLKKSFRYFATFLLVPSSTFRFDAFAFISFSMICSARTRPQHNTAKHISSDDVMSR
jgi:hypothetical protein